MVFTRPLLFDFTGAHSIVSAFHTDSSYIDMSYNNRHQHKTDDRVPELGILHFFVGSQSFTQLPKPKQSTNARGIDLRKGRGKHVKLERKQQRQARHRD